MVVFIVTDSDDGNNGSDLTITVILEKEES